MMFQVVKRQSFSPTTFLWEVWAPDVTRAAQPGQFVMVRLKEEGERIPLTVANPIIGRNVALLIFGPSKLPKLGQSIV